MYSSIDPLRIMGQYVRGYVGGNPADYARNAAKNRASLKDKLILIALSCDYGSEPEPQSVVLTFRDEHISISGPTNS